MSTLAQEEADRFFSPKEHYASHPEDRQEETFQEPDDNIVSSTSQDDDENNDEDSLHNMSTTTLSTSTYHLPHTRFEANTGPKGVIADAQSFTRAKRSTFRKTLAGFTNSLSLKAPQSQPQPGSRTASDHSANSELDTDEDEEFMKQWRQNRFQELSASGAAHARRHSPSKRVWGSLDEVDANGYLDAIEKVGDDVVVLVCIYDPASNASAEVEDVLSTLASKYSTTKFVKLHQDIAEMSHIASPAILAYKAGDVFATISDCKAEGLEGTLKRQRILR